MTDIEAPRQALKTRWFDRMLGRLRGAEKVTTVNRNWVLFELPNEQLMVRTRTGRVLFPLVIDRDDAVEVAHAILDAQARREAERDARLQPPPVEGGATTGED